MKSSTSALSSTSTRSRIPWLLLWLSSLAGGIGGLLLFALPFDWLKPLVDRLSPDRSLEIYTPAAHAALRFPALVAGVVLLFSALALFAWRRQVQGFLAAAGIALHESPRQFWSDWRVFASHLHRALADWPFTLGILFLIVVAIVARWLLIAQPFRYDESYTILEFAIQPIRDILSDYHLPNNHIFHSLLVGLSYRLFGAEPWAVRLPVLAAGVALVPAIYLAGRALYDRWTGLLAAACVAGAWNLIDYSANARGYMLLALFSSLQLGLAAYLKSHRNLAGWAFFILTGVLGFYTLPVMLYPFALICAWLGLSWLVGDFNRSYGRSFPLYLLMAVSFVAILSACLYLPVIFRNGVSALVGNRWVESLTWREFSENLPVRALVTWQVWLRGLLPGLGEFLLALVLFGQGLHLWSFFQPAQLRSRLGLGSRVSTLLAGVLALGLILPIQRVAPIAKVWLFAQPWFFLWASAGLVGLVRLVLRRRVAPVPTRLELVPIGLALVLSGVLAWSSLTVTPVLAHLESDVAGVSDETALFLKANLQPGEAVIVGAPVNYPLRYYFLRYDVPQAVLYDPSRSSEYTRLWVVVSRLGDQTLAGQLARVQAPASFDPASAVLAFEYRTTSLYIIDRR